MASARVAQIIIAMATCLPTLQAGHAGFQVKQDARRTVNTDGVASIRCQHTTNATAIIDARLNHISAEGQRSMLCQKPMSGPQGASGGACRRGDVLCLDDSPGGCVFVLLGLGLHNLSGGYECEFTAEWDGLYTTERGRPTRMLLERNSSQCVDQGETEPPAPVILLGLPVLTALLAALLLYSCTITFCCIRMKKTRSEDLYESLTNMRMQVNQAQVMGSQAHPEMDATYVDMRKAPLGRARPGTHNQQGAHRAPGQSRNHT